MRAVLAAGDGPRIHPVIEVWHLSLELSTPGRRKNPLFAITHPVDDEDPAALIQRDEGQEQHLYVTKEAAAAAAP